MKAYIWIFVALSACTGLNCQVNGSPSAGEPIQQPKWNPNCPPDGGLTNSTYLPDAHDCGRFHRCIGEYTLLMTCPSNFHWSVELNRCVYYTTANCLRKESRTVIGNGDPHPDCPLNDDPFNPTKLPYPGDCSRFYMCSYGRGFIMSCFYGLHFDVNANRCESPFFAKCDVYTPATTTPTPPSRQTQTPPRITNTPTPAPTTRVTTMDPNLPGPAPECSDVSSTRKFGIPGECKKYLQCYRGYAYRISCREGREWSEPLNECVDAGIAGCLGTTTVTTTTTAAVTKSSTTRSTTIKTTSHPVSCGEGVAYLSHPTDCHKFIQCDNYNPVERDCPGGLYWSKTAGICDWSPNDC